MSESKEKKPFVIELQSNYGTTAPAIQAISSSPSTLYCLHGKPQVKIVGHCHRQRTEGVDVKARRKLIIASILCLVFMVAEIVGGVLSNSLAIATDAAHLLTDFASFMISLFAIWLAGRPSTQRMSFGWYRAEVIGAVVSVVMIWIITGILLYLAVLRIVHKTYEVDATIMLITSGFAILVNVIMGCQLHHHGHTHGGKTPTTTLATNLQSSNHAMTISRRSSKQTSQANMDADNKIGHILDDTSGVVGSGMPTTPNTTKSHIIEKETGHINFDDPGHQHRLNADTTTTDESNALVNIISTSGQVVGLQQLKNSNQNGNYEMQTTAGNTGGESEQHSHHSHQTGTTENINVRAAFIHVLGDVLQSVGVFIAALVIYFRPDWAIADPICTFVFSVIVLFTTFSIMKDALLVLMEGTPGYLHYAEVMNVFLQIDGVQRVHNLRIWALSINKVALSAHLAVKPGVDPKQILREATSVVHLKYNFFETTIQIEDFSPEMEDCTQCHVPGQ